MKTGFRVGSEGPGGWVQSWFRGPGGRVRVGSEDQGVGSGLVLGNQRIRV